MKKGRISNIEIKYNTILIHLRQEPKRPSRGHPQPSPSWWTSTAAVRSQLVARRRYFRPPGHSPTGIPTNGRGRSATLRGCHLGPPLPKTAWTCTEESREKWREKEGQRRRTGLAEKADSFIGSCDYSPRRHRHRARLLTGVAATGTKPLLRRSCYSALGPPHTQAQHVIQVCFWFWLRPWRPLDDEDDPLSWCCGRWWRALHPRPKRRPTTARQGAKAPPGEGWARPGTKDRRSRSRSNSSGGPTKYTQCWFLLLHRPVARADAAVKATPSAQCYGRVVWRGWCRSPKADVRELLKAAPEVSFIGPSGHRCPLHVNDCQTSEEVVPGIQYVCV
jgi:hypothetical protein